MNLSNLQVGLCIVLASIVSSACGIQPLPGQIDKALYLKQGVEARILGKGSAPNLGLALAGGGTKAADFSIGVLQGLTEAGIMEQVDAVSTVSGGGYAALWYFARLLNPEENRESASAPLTSSLYASQFFRDCIPQKYIRDYLDTATLQGSPSRHNYDSKLPWSGPCPQSKTNYKYPERSELSNGGVRNQGVVFEQDPVRYQNHLRGYQDVLAWNWRRPFGYEETTLGRASVITELIGTGLLTVGSMAANLVPNVVFDWEVPLSSSSQQYRSGILRTFGAIPSDCAVRSDYCGPHFRLQGGEAWVRSGLTFELLKNEYEKGKIPLWIINATAGENRDLFSAIAHPGQKPFQLTSFEFSPYGSGSGLFNYSTQSLLGQGRPWHAVALSAAFFDAQQKVKPPIWNILLNVSTFNWGSSFENTQVHWFQRALHKFLPLPFYLLHLRSGESAADYVNIRLSDGGQSENLGVYALVERNLGDIIVSDHSGDRSGKMEDVCRLKIGLEREHGSSQHLYVYFPGLLTLDDVCDQRHTGKNEGYDIFHWEHPILLGCITDNVKYKDCIDDKLTSGAHFQRLYLIKPAFPSGKLASKLGLALKGITHIVAKTNDTCTKQPNLKVCAPSAVPACVALPAGQPYPYGVRLRHHKPDSLATWEYEDFVSCELVGFLIANSTNDNGKNGSDGCAYVPQNDTAGFTTNSSPFLFGAYRELGRYYARQLGWFFGDGSNASQRRARYREAVAYQKENGLKPEKITKEGGKAGDPGDCFK